MGSNMADAKIDQMREKIAAAATRCFKRFGAQRTSMNDIADEAGYSRQTVYRMFEDRSVLVNFILDKRMMAIADKAKKHIESFDTLEEALVEGSIVSVRLGRQDKIANDIMSNTLDHPMELFILQGGTNIHQRMMDLWTPWLERGRAAGVIRPEISNDKIVEWIRHVHTLLMVRDDQDEAAQRELLQNFLVPSIASRAAPRTPA
jgi:AcrR family transcriptional regulator